MNLKIKCITCVFLLLVSGVTFGGSVEPNKARSVATNWYRHYAPASKKQASITKIKEYKWGDRTSFYICSFDKGGFVLVSANDAVTPVLGYGFDYGVPDEITNEAVKGWFDNYARQIDTAFVLNLRSNEESAKWEAVLKNNFPKLPGDTVEPLLTTTWGQGWPYNEMCPEDPSGPGGHTLIGCVGIAMAQIFKYHNYPERGIGEYSYNSCNYGIVTAKFDSINYEWIDMPNMINEPNQNIAKICSDAAISVASNFGPFSTSVTWVDGTTPRNPVEPAMISFFDYAFSELRFLKRSNYIDTEWKDIILQEINLNRPAYYRADDESGTVGHAWVIDGYASYDFFHCNWGWDGTFNGFFILDELIAGGYNFNTDQMVLIGIKPNDGSSINNTETWNGDTTISNKIAIGNSAILNLDAGTILRFAENAHMEVWGTVKCNGTINDSVYFMPIDNTSGWNGIKFERGYNLPGFFAENDTSIFQNTVIEYSVKTACYINFFNKVKFDGCNIRNNSNLDFSLQWAGGIHIIESDVNIKNSIFFNNLADFGGGISILLTITNNQITICNNQFINNSANYCGGGLKLQVDNSNGLISNNTFLNNYAGRGGGAYLYATNCKLINNTFKYNHGEWTGGGIYIDGYYSGETILFQNQIISNTGGMGPGIHIWLSNPKIINNLISDNLVTLYGNANPLFINNTFFQSGFYNQDEKISVNANILEIYDTTCDPYLFYNLIPGGKEGFIGVGAGNAYDTTRFINNIDANPEFIDPENLDYHLLFSSPLINSGISDSILLDLPSYDFDGNARFINDTIDIGIYEFCGPRQLGIITGTTTVCQGQNSVAYSVTAIANATGYIWAYSGTGATLNGTTDSIEINFAANATSGELTVMGVNLCGNGPVSESFSITVLNNQQVDLYSGWNIASFYVHPQQPSMDSVLSSLIVGGSLVKIINESGGFIQNIPGIGWLNTVGDMQNTEGYYIKMDTEDTLSLSGAKVNLPFEIPLQTGWNIMGYPVQESQDALNALQPIINSGSLTKVINESGGFIQNIPGMGWLNTIGDFEPGEGYYIKVSSNDTLAINDPIITGTLHHQFIEEGTFFHRATQGNPYLPMHIVANFNDNIQLVEGDELAVFAGDQCLGSSLIEDFSTPIAVFLTTDDPTTEIIDGGQQGDMLTFKLLHQGKTYLLECQNHQSVSYEPLETQVVNFTTTWLDVSTTVTTGFKVSEVIPNPFSTEARIYVTIPETGNLKIEVLDLRGVVIKTLFESEVLAQKLEVKIEGKELRQGMYFIHVRYNNENTQEEVLRKVVMHER